MSLVKVKTEEAKATRLLLVVNTLGVFGSPADEVLSNDFILHHINNVHVLGKGGDAATKHGASPVRWESEARQTAEVRG